MLRAIVLLAASLGKSIIAEGVESADQMEQLRLLGCPAGQGHHLARPLPSGLVGKLLVGSIAHRRGRQAPERVAAELQIH